MTSTPPGVSSGRLERREHIEILPAPNLPGVALVVMENSSHLWNLYHETYTFTTGLDMACKARYRGSTHAAPRAFLGTFEPGDIHRIERWETGLHTARGLLVPPAVVWDIADQCHIRRSRLHVANPITDARRIYGAFQRLHAALEGPASDLERQSRFLGCVRLVLECGLENTTAAAPVRNERDAVRRARLHLEDHYRENVQLDVLAGVARLSKYHLIRAFTREIGTPPHDYLLQVRLARARDLLRRGKPLAWVASETGFYDQSALTRYFKRSFGVTPGHFASAYRHHAAEGEGPI
jgi:AraC-like DNA-binding protein